MSLTGPAGVVERMLDHAANARWDELREVLGDGFEIVEPASLPYGGIHHGLAGYRALMQEIAALFEMSFEPGRIVAIDENDVLLQMSVSFTSRTTGRTARMDVLELLTVEAGRVERSDVYLQDTAALLATLTA